MKKLELLAPARDLEHGKTAIDYGADAVYIGGPAFGARHAATNSVEDIGKLVKYAHLFGARVYVVLNTIIFDSELDEAQKIANDIIRTNADALIIQDMAFMRMGLNNIELHASTQMCNTSAEHVAFLENSGFSRVILERGLTLEQIREIRESSSVELEAFVHGAICVGYSGQCYLSRSIGPRSGNRGECSQACRLKYDLVTESGRVVCAEKHLLSVQDMNLSSRLSDLIKAGITSFKIEGRLKEENYIKNVVAHYRKELDKIIAASDGELERSSSGNTIFDFQPDPAKTFSRGGGLWMLDGKTRGVASFDTPKAMGAYIGKVTKLDRTYFEVESTDKLIGGDGICFISNGHLFGTNINNVEGSRIYPNKLEGLKTGIDIYRNNDVYFTSLLKRSRTKRFINATATVNISPSEVKLKITDSDAITVEVTASDLVEQAANPQKMLETLKTQISKTGDSIFQITNVEINCDQPIPFMSVSSINQIRRQAISELTKIREEIIPARKIVPENISYPHPSTHLGGEANITNSLARKFHQDHGVDKIDYGFDLASSFRGIKVMTTAYCIRRELGECLKKQPKIREALFLRTGNVSYRLVFDCKNCLMTVYKE